MEIQNMVIIIPFDSTVYKTRKNVLTEMIKSLLGCHWYGTEFLYSQQELKKIFSQNVISDSEYKSNERLITVDFHKLYYALFPSVGMLFNKELPVTIGWESAGISTYVFIEIDRAIWSVPDDYGDNAI